MAERFVGERTRIQLRGDEKIYEGKIKSVDAEKQLITLIDAVSLPFSSADQGMRTLTVHGGDIVDIAILPSTNAPSVQNGENGFIDPAVVSISAPNGAKGPGPCSSTENSEAFVDPAVISASVVKKFVDPAVLSSVVRSSTSQAGHNKMSFVDPAVVSVGEQPSPAQQKTPLGLLQPGHLLAQSKASSNGKAPSSRGRKGSNSKGPAQKGALPLGHNSSGPMQGTGGHVTKRRMTTREKDWNGSTFDCAVDGTAIQEDFDFEANLLAFDKKSVWAEIRREQAEGPKAPPAPADAFSAAKIRTDHRRMRDNTRALESKVVAMMRHPADCLVGDYLNEMEASLRRSLEAVQAAKARCGCATPQAQPESFLTDKQISAARAEARPR